MYSIDSARSVYVAIEANHILDASSVSAARVRNVFQLLVVVLVASAFAALRARSVWAQTQLVYAGSIVVIAAGSFWFVQRVFFPTIG